MLERAAAILQRKGRTRATVQKKKTESFASIVRDPAGEKRVGDIARECRAKGIKFVDKEFPADTKALFIDPSAPSAAMSKVKDELANIRWMRPDQMGDPNEKPQVFAEGIDPEDINQGSIGDCYFLAALAICATREELILDLIVEDFAEDGIYGVKLCVLGEWKTIIVDDLLPCRNEKGRWMPIFARWKGTKETWAMIAEKAWAKFHGSYEAIGGGRTEDALAYLSAGFSVSNSLDDKEHEGSLWERLKSNLLLNSDEMGVFISTSGVDEDVAKRGGLDDPHAVTNNTGGLVSGHAYSLLNVAEVSGGHKLVHLRNPWGSYEWSGDWGDKSPLWTPERKKQVGFVDAEDGSFWMSLDDYKKNFSLVGICKTLPPNRNHMKVNGEWKAGSSAGGPRDNLVGFNPTYKLSNVHRDVWFQIEQPDIRGKPFAAFTRCSMYVLKESSVKTDETTGARVFSPAQSVIPILTMGDERQKSIECSLDPSQGPYYVVISAWRAGIEGTFQVSIASPKPFTFARLPDSRPTAEQAQLMTKAPLSRDCIACSKALDLHSHISLKGAHWHPAPSCNRCEGCKKPFNVGAAVKASGAGESQQKIHDIGFAGGKWGAYCFNCFNPRFGEQCLMCKKPLLHHEHDNDPCVAIPGEGKMHQECVPAYHASKSDKCAHCGEPVVGIAGKFSGQYYTTDMGSANGKLPAGETAKQVHVECWNKFEQGRALKCLQCREPIFEIPGKFTGSYFPVETPVKGGVHAECLETYNKLQGPKCIHCGEVALPVPGKFTGRCYVLEGDKKLHEECHTAYQHSLAKKCHVCKEPILPIPGKFSGNYFNKDGFDIHAECKEAFLISKAKKCAQCSEPIVKKEGKFSGSYFPMENNAFVHEECYKAYTAAGKK